MRQIYRICTMYWDDKYGTHSVSTDVCSHLLFCDMQFSIGVQLNISGLFAGCCQNEGHGEQ